ncbi:protein involved in catabolism of external DNA [Legionella geestiana]|uniref:Ribosomal RNA large subunit methyltransferase J n=1 Tax=Legionella geestiana TaxID=45065 RepID=A0A0W0TYM9_9GAMM|nr:23S rRNA (adenine(2030)-N(6))-methyltransferase RlmJ [Legionella geestiana]KTD00736.1 protein involved in catabolism of external DNA [Legionella geestiana]QBS11593.1 23S rRNA (adenine(2030)-N(6))-methyltransferase RlmJ [Legionella geestiana]QDQ40798.1 23S rRNA (adenine(2030)-N(6))-methyltransferase RlmJ [Legionella geestiana]STX53729.1 protein involved in catabolism of external DNA [Legionella geestiana]
MLSYQHGYHAGNFADILKHATLIQALSCLTEKPKPLFYLETHAGRGFYDLQSDAARKTGECVEGIQKIWESRARLPEEFTPWMTLLRRLNPDNTLRFYPGSPSLAMEFLRPIDRLYCCELHPREFAHLSALPRAGRRIFFSESDGLHALSALLPPPENRGLILIDPSFELEKEYAEVPAAVKEGLRRFATGVYCLWYPIVDNKLNARLQRNLAIPGTRALQAEFHLREGVGPRMNGCGMWIINPPWKLETKLASILKTMVQVLDAGKASFVLKNHSF